MADINPQQQLIAESLHRIPFFKSLSAKTLAAISARLRKMHFEHGEVVFVENSLGDSMYLIESGQIKVSIATGVDQQEKVINFLGPGNFFGEMALLLNQRRSATVTVTLDADLWVLRKADLDELLAEYPEIALQLSRELSRRLSDVVAETQKRPGYNLVASFGDKAWRLAEHVHQITQQRVVLFDATGRNLVNQISPEAQNENLVVLQAMEQLSSASLVETLSILVDGYDWVILALPPGYSEVNDKALQLAQATVLLNAPQQSWVADLVQGPVFSHGDSEVEVGRAARRITQRVVGLALSSGGARGIAHIGVLKTLAENNFPIDMIAGTSAGSLFGGLYAIGKTPAEVAAFAKNLIKLIDFKSGLWDPKFNLPWNGLIKGNATLKYLDKQFNHATFADTKIPFYVVSADVFSGEQVVFEQGPLAEAVRASIGIIGIFAPYQLNGHSLIDGGAVNPLPASVLAEKGANIIIASSVIPSIEEERARGRAKNAQPRHPNFFGVLTSMMAIMEREIVKTHMSPVDLLIRPRVEVYTAMDYDRADDFMRLGREATLRELPQLQKLFRH